MEPKVRKKLDALHILASRSPKEEFARPAVQDSLSRMLRKKEVAEKFYDELQMLLFWMDKKRQDKLMQAE